MLDRALMHFGGANAEGSGRFEGKSFTNAPFEPEPKDGVVPLPDRLELRLEWRKCGGNPCNR